MHPPFSSLPHFRADLLLIPAVQGTSLTFSTLPHGNTSTFRCSLTRPHSDGTDAPCTFLLSANSSPRTGTVTVDVSSPEHSCLLWQRKATAEQARRGCQRALDELRGAEPPTKRKVGQTRRPLQNSSSKTALVDSDTEPSDSSSTTVAQTIYPSAASLTADVQALLAVRNSPFHLLIESRLTLLPPRSSVPSSCRPLTNASSPPVFFSSTFTPTPALPASPSSAAVRPSRSIRRGFTAASTGRRVEAREKRSAGSRSR